MHKEDQPMLITPDGEVWEDTDEAADEVEPEDRPDGDNTGGAESG